MSAWGPAIAIGSMVAALLLGAAVTALAAVQATLTAHRPGRRL